MSLTRIGDGDWRVSGSFDHPVFQSTLQAGLNSLDDLFSRARRTSEFEFILSLLRIRGVQGTGWDPFETMEDIYRSFGRTRRHLRDDKEVTYYALFLYGLIIEASEPYEILANMLNVAEGRRFSAINFPDLPSGPGRTRPQSPVQKLRQIRERTTRLGIPMTFLEGLIDNQLRNAVFHSDFTVAYPSIRIRRPPRELTHAQWHALANRALAYFESLLQVYYFDMRSYSKPTTVDVHPAFASVPGQQAITLIRRNFGLVGIQSNWSEAQRAQGHIPFRLARPLPYEVKLLDRGALILPPNRYERFNRFVNPLPTRLKRWLVKRMRQYLNR